MQRADRPQGVHVCAAAQLDRVITGLDHTHDVAVLLAEKSHGARTFGFLAGRLVDSDGLVAQDLGVDEILRAPDLLLGHRPEVAEVEPQAVRRYERALLTNVVAEHLS